MVAQPVWLEDDGEGFLLGVAASVPAWQRDALCAEPAYNADDWFPEQGFAPTATGRAKSVCARCAVQSECLGFALDMGGELPGVWGGTSQPDRKLLHRRKVTGDLVRKYGPHVDAGRELDLDLASFAGLDDVDGEYARALAELLDDDDDA